MFVHLIDFQKFVAEKIVVGIKDYLRAASKK